MTAQEQYHIALLDAAIEQHGPAGLVAELRVCVQRSQRARAVFVMSAMIRVTNINDQVALARAGAASAVADAIAGHPSDKLTVCAGLGALDKCWPSGEGAHDAQTTRRVVQTAIDAIRAHVDLIVHHAALRLLKVHALSAHNLVLSPQTIHAVQRATQAFPSDDTIQFYAAQAVAGFCSIEPADVIHAHGQSGFDLLSEAAIAIAVAAASQPTELLIRDRPWTEVILSLYPRLRSQAQRAAQ